MTLHINSSGSQGNSYYLDDGKEILLVEAGIKYIDILRSVNYQFDRVVGCLVSHDHKSDHSKSVDDLAKRGIQIFSTEHLAKNHPQANIIVPAEMQWFPIGSYSVMPFPVHHDIPNNGYVIKHLDMGSLFFATDCEDVSAVFKGINHFLIEANYSDSKLLLSDTDKAQKRRIMESHQSFESCVQYLQQAHAENAKTITLIHLSSRHSAPDTFRKDIEKTFGVPCFIARKGLTIEL